jgi:DNA polymerase I-like protein with 3'-5' exonuclease and polymerase domains
MNRLIQGSAADQTKQAMVDIDSAGHFLHFPVHDEVCLSISSRAEVAEIVRMMEQAVDLRIPSVAEASVGPSWGELASV